MLKVVDGWDPVIQAVIKKVPAESIIDWKLLWRDPSKQWVSKKGGVVMAGDSAHPHLATSGSGAAQAIEDAATLGAVIDKLGAKDIPLAFKVFQELRYVNLNSPNISAAVFTSKLFIFLAKPARK